MKKEENFESKMEELEKIVQELEKGDLSLEDSVSKFEEGMRISKECNTLLNNVEKKISIILEKNGEIEEKDFSVDE